MVINSEDIRPINRVPVDFSGVSAIDKGKEGYFIEINKDSCSFTMSVSEEYNTDQAGPYVVSGIEIDKQITSHQICEDYPPLPVVWDWGEIERTDGAGAGSYFTVKIDENTTGKKRKIKIYIFDQIYTGNAVYLYQQPR